MNFIKTHKFFVFCILLGIIIASTEENISFVSLLILGPLVGCIFYFSIVLPIKLIKKIVLIIKTHLTSSTNNLSRKVISEKSSKNSKIKTVVLKKKTLKDEISELKKIAQNNRPILSNNWNVDNLDLNTADNDSTLEFKITINKNTRVIEDEDDIDDDFDLPGYGAIIWEDKNGMPINFDYTNAKGIYSERKILLKRIYKDSKTRFYFWGHCLLRESMRTFISTNVENIYDDNGVIIELPDFIDTLVGYKAYGTKKIKEIK